MYLSRIALDARRFDVQRAIAVPPVFHAAIEGCFPPREEGNERKLWRLDVLQGKMYLLLLSPRQPDFAGFAAQFCAPEVSGEIRDYSALLARIQPNSKWYFRLRANPTRCASRGKGNRGKISAHVTPAQQCEWLQNKAAKHHGFALTQGTFDTVQTDYLRFSRSAQREREVTINAVTFEGQLTVTDLEKFRTALCQGIGRAKAYGCGLLTVARL